MTVRIPTINATSDVVEPADLPLRLQAKTLTLTNAQILALPTTPVTVLAAQGAGKDIVILGGMAKLDSSAGEYTNIAADNAQFGLTQDPVIKVERVQRLMDDSVTEITRFTDTFGIAAIQTWPLLPIMHGTLGGVELHPYADAASNTVNKALVARIGNASSGNLTGGNAANTLTITILFVVVDV